MTTHSVQSSSPAVVARTRQRVTQLRSRIEIHVNYLQTRTAHAGLSDVDRAHNGTILAAAKSGQRRLAEIRTRAGEYERFIQTRVIADAVASSLGNEYVSDAKAEWQLGSGAAHGLIFPILEAHGRGSQNPPTRTE